MEHGEPSWTARATAYARAYHQIADEPLIFTDPLASRLLGVTDDKLAELDATALARPGQDAETTRQRRLFLAARSRFAEDTVHEAFASGVRQVVILGAGLDTFAYRNPHPELRVFEVDHPATQAWKRERLTASGIALPASLVFAPVDFETGTLAAGLADAGFDRSQPAVFVWLGVIFYLTTEAITGTLEYVAGQSDSVLVFDYLQPAADDADRADMRARSERLAAIGEPFLSVFTPTQIAERLRAAGFTRIEDHSAPDLIDGYRGAAAAEHPLRPTQVLRSARILRAAR
ncbi:SAM-dependent methyltransferase [Nocardia yunnanensis]|uniref:S-adenosyl-L-methionine-dependent methyltransferase n=1 Tax=Nocardia yunnanensis TaxID=2382165 RepID=A0A386ZMY8_9NOCA|nr:class I SAM-dependent methyltransferase [Nocardia yunnanensis]AYF78059.1 SAM-dependent methyltransferase [Nocardia yunnanensis]